MSAPAIVLASSDSETLRALQAAGCTLVFAQTADELLRVLDSGSGDVAIVDLEMLSSSGGRIAEAVAAKRPGMPVIALGEPAEPPFPLQIRYSVRPGDRVSLLATLERALQGTAAEPSGGKDSLSRAVEAHLARYFEAHAPGLPGPGLHGRVLREVERSLIAHALSATRGNQLRAATLLGLNRNTLRKKIRDLDIEVVRGIR